MAAGHLGIMIAFTVSVMKNIEKHSPMIKRERRMILVTGATGNIGAALVARLLEQDRSAHLILLVRGESVEPARQRVESTIRFLSPEFDLAHAADRVAVLTGDITRDYLGLSKPMWNSVARLTTEIVHCAAATKFLLPLACSRSINCAGTANVLKLAEHAHLHGGLRQLVHVSTAYVCGDRAGLILEDDQAVPTKFSNNYEQTKWEAEQLVRRCMTELPISIVRPSVVVGDSRNGRTTAFNVMYTPLKMAFDGRLPCLPCYADAQLDVVPLEYVADALAHITFHYEQTVGRTFNLTAGQGRTISGKEIIARGMELYRGEGLVSRSAKVRFISPAVYKLALSLVRGRSRRLLQLASPYAPYLAIKRHFSSSNTDELLSQTSICVPHLTDYLETLIHFALKTNWGKRMEIAARAA